MIGIVCAFFHTEGKGFYSKLTELHIPDETIAELLGHKNTDSVSYYRKISNKVMAKETRKSREKMDDILRDIINQWDGYEVVE